MLVIKAAGIYPSYALPVYAGAKHGVVGFMRSLAPGLAKENIRVNCTMPGAVQTNLCDEDTWKMFPKDQFTSTSNIVDTVARLLDDPSITGKAVEISKDKWYYRDQHEFCDEAQARVMGAAGESSY
jgi:NAD(P)-dependent dehydrogenase (short-subunit alcohol dehydrogenase family)